MNRLPINHNYFSNWKSDDNVLYWAGFLMADGCIYKNSIKISLAEKDKNHLEKLKQDLETTLKLTKNISRNSKRNPNWKDSVCYHVTFSSKKLVNDLYKLGIEKQKTFTSKFPDMIKESKNINAYCRGYFDGDGGFSFHKPTTRKMSPQLVVGIRGTKSFLKSFNEILVDKAGLPSRCLDKSMGPKNIEIGYLMYNGNNICIQIAKWLYSNMNKRSRYMERKYNLVKDRI